MKRKGRLHQPALCFVHRSASERVPRPGLKVGQTARKTRHKSNPMKPILLDVV